MGGRDDKEKWTRRAFASGIAVGGAGLAAASVHVRERMMEQGAQHSGRLPSLYIPHGGGPCFFMDWTMGPPDTWNRMSSWLRTVGKQFSGARALLVVSAHWEERVVTVQSAEKPSLFFDYYGFPDHTYQLTWPAPGAPDVATRVRELLTGAGIDSAEDRQRGFDHGTFIPMKVAFPGAEIPTLQLSLDTSLDPADHIRIGRALTPLRDEGVLIIGSGMSFHNMQAMMRPGAALDRSREFDSWLGDACTGEPERRGELLTNWTRAPEGRYCHPREEHLLPLMVVAGAGANDQGRKIFSDQVMGVKVSAFEFGGSA